MVDTVSKGIDDDNFKMRFQSYGVRVLDPLTVYTNLLAAFVASSKSPLIVGVNIVAPENNHTALQDYTLHMQMFNYLHSKYPTVNKALHAGELTLGMVRPKNLVFHIDEALNIAGAQRIGHGVDISYENNSIELLKQLKNNAAIEINLTSNEFILGVKNNKHPYLIYKQFGVPMVISTDDSGVSRNNLTNEYVLLATRYKPTYSEVKMYVYNSITYAFLSDALKAELKKQLDTKFVAFEEMVSGFGE
jgi:adenosine deaminase/adenosine deaminase CECR1